MKHLIIIPGIGDDHPAYHVAAVLFRASGYTTDIQPFGWGSMDSASYQMRFAGLEAQVMALPGPVYILGVSAGGPVAVSMLAAHSDKVMRVATLCSPLAHFSYQVNPLLAVAIEHVEGALGVMPSELKQRILSVHGRRDMLVPTKLSQPSDTRTVILPTFQHVISIFLGMTLLRRPIRQFFARP